MLFAVFCVCCCRCQELYAVWLAGPGFHRQGGGALLACLCTDAPRSFSAVSESLGQSIKTWGVVTFYFFLSYRLVTLCFPGCNRKLLVLRPPGSLFLTSLPPFLLHKDERQCKCFHCPRLNRAGSNPWPFPNWPFSLSLKELTSLYAPCPKHFQTTAV